MNKQKLASKIWESANKMRSKIEASEYKDYILGFMFYKYLSEYEEKFLYSNDYEESDIAEVSEDDEDTVDFVRNNIGFFISYENLFSTWIKMGADFDVSNVRDALSAFSRLINPSHKKVFEGIFNTLETGLKNLGDSSGSQTKAVRDLIHLINDIPMDGKQDYDVLGFIYEYLISMFAANAGKKAGEFYTPHEVSELMSEIVAYHLRDKKEIKIFDPTSGSGSLLITIGKSIAKVMDDKDHIQYYAQELKQNTYNLTRMNLVMRGINPSNIVTRNADTLEEDWPYFDDSDPNATYEPLYVDAVVSNPPYSQPWNPDGKENDARYAKFGIAPKSKADYAFLLHDLYHIKPDGIMTIVLPHGVLFRGGEEGQIRKNLIEFNNIDAIIGLPANIFFGTGIPTIIMVLRQKRVNEDVLIIDASKGFEKVGKNNKLRASDIRRIVDTYKDRLEIEKFSKRVSREEIRANDYNLNIPRYVDSSEDTEHWDIYASMFGGVPETELNQMKEFWEAFPSLKSELFDNASDGYLKLGVEDVGSAIRSNKDVKEFISAYAASLDSLPKEMKSLLIDNIGSVSPQKAENEIAANIFEKLSGVRLVDKYEAYQHLDDSWNTISSDVESIQTEGIDAVRAVDPNLVIKKKGDKESEVQEGWKGHIVPFELIENLYLEDELKKQKRLADRIQEMDSECAGIIEGLTEEEKEKFLEGFDDEEVSAKHVVSHVNHLLLDSSLAVIKNLPSSVNTNAKKIKTKITSEKLPEDSIEYKALRVEELQTELKQLKTEAKNAAERLEVQAKEKIEALTDAEIEEVLFRKWILPVTEGIGSIPQRIIDGFISSVSSLAKKYETTMMDVESEILSAEKELASMIDELTGSPSDMSGLEELKKLLMGV